MAVGDFPLNKMCRQLTRVNTPIGPHNLSRRRKSAAAWKRGGGRK
jgi:hypothetical protein